MFLTNKHSLYSIT